MIRRLSLLALLLLLTPQVRADEARAAAQGEGPPPLFSEGPGKLADVDRATSLRFTPRRQGTTAVLLVWGHVHAGDSERFREAIKQAGSKVVEVQFLSGGGDLEEGLQIGRIMRAEGMIAHIPRGYVCASACNFMFLGGVARSIDPGGQFVVHIFDREEMPAIIVESLREASTQAMVTLRSAQASAAPSPGSPGMRSSASVGPEDAKPPPAGAPAAPQQGPPQGDMVDEILGALNCPNRTELQPEDLDETVEARLNKANIRDPAERAPLAAMLKVMTLVSLCTEQEDARQSAEVARFLVDMRLSLRFLTTFAAIPNAHARALTRDELRDFNIVNTE